MLVSVYYIDFMYTETQKKSRKKHLPGRLHIAGPLKFSTVRQCSKVGQRGPCKKKKICIICYE